MKNLANIMGDPRDAIMLRSTHVLKGELLVSLRLGRVEVNSTDFSILFPFFPGMLGRGFTTVRSLGSSYSSGIPTNHLALP